MAAINNQRGQRIRIVPAADIIPRANLQQMGMTLKEMYQQITLEDQVINGVNWRVVEWLARHRMLTNEKFCPRCQGNMRLVDSAKAVTDRIKWSEVTDYTMG